MFRTFTISINSFLSFCQALTKMKQDWEFVEFGLITYRDTDVKILSAVDDIQNLLDDHVVKTHTMKGSPFIEPFVDEIEQWEKTLVSCN